ncbi:hypothetical protein [Variovorax sp. W2I14]|uniref:hypothetical protein n=1 Tax=Variovorax sp. W2I14 TaxID=3042290 RepID=UPI003D203F29
MDHRFLFAHDYALINPLQVEASAWEAWPAKPIAVPQLGTQSLVLPRLLSLRVLTDAESTTLYEQVLKWEKANPDRPFFTALFATDLSEERVLNRLGSRFLHRRTPQEHVLLRWYDPRVFCHLLWLLDKAQLAQLLGPLHVWSWRDAARVWHQYERAAIPTTFALFRPSPAQWATLGRIGVLNRILVYLESEYPGLQVKPAQAEQFLAQAYETWDMEDESDCRLFVEQALCIHPEIHQHPAIRERLQQVRRRECSYVGACADLDPSDLQSMASRFPGSL